MALLVDGAMLTSAPETVTFTGEDFLLLRRSQRATCDLPGRTTKGFSFCRELLTPACLPGVVTLSVTFRRGPLGSPGMGAHFLPGQWNPECQLFSILGFAICPVQNL